MNKIIIILIILFIYSNQVLSNNQIFSQVKKNPICLDELLLKQWLPSSFNVGDPIGYGHYHLVIFVDDRSLAALVNWLAISFSLNYLPSPRILIHFSCEGHNTKRFVEEYLLQECLPPSKRIVYANESHIDKINKNKISIVLDLLLQMDETDYGLMIFNYETIWIRNMAVVFDFYGKAIDDTTGCDYISMGYKHNINYITKQNIIIPKFDSSFFKNTIFIKEVAKKIYQEINDEKYSYTNNNKDVIHNYNKEMDITHYFADFFFLSHKFYFSNTLIPELSNLNSGNSQIKSENGLLGDFSFKDNDKIKAKYLIFPQLVASETCGYYCSNSTTIIENCEVNKCMHKMNKESSNHCKDISEYILNSHSSHIHNFLANSPEKHGFKHAIFGTFDAQTSAHMVKTVSKFIDIHKLHKFCAKYSSICTAILTKEISTNSNDWLHHNFHIKMLD